MFGTVADDFVNTSSANVLFSMKCQTRKLICSPISTEALVLEFLGNTL